MKYTKLGNTRLTRFEESYMSSSSADLFDAIQSGILKVDPTNIYRFDQLIHAHQQLEQRRTVGATVLHV
jgi:NADPH2:quinone reductase